MNEIDIWVATLYLFGLLMCLHAVYVIFADIGGSPLCPGFAPGFAGFAFFPVINTLIGIVLLAFWLRRKAKTRGQFYAAFVLAPALPWGFATVLAKTFGIAP